MALCDDSGEYELCSRLTRFDAHSYCVYTKGKYRFKYEYIFMIWDVKCSKNHYVYVFNYFCIIRFAAKRNSGKYIPNGLITSDTEQVDAFDVFNPSIGEFKVKTNIVYVFSFDSRNENSRYKIASCETCYIF